VAYQHLPPFLFITTRGHEGSCNYLLCAGQVKQTLIPDSTKIYQILHYFGKFGISRSLPGLAKDVLFCFATFVDLLVSLPSGLLKMWMINCIGIFGKLC